MREFAAFWREHADVLTSGIVDRLGLDTGVLIIFDRRPKAAPIAERTRFEATTSPSGRPITVLRA